MVEVDALDRLGKMVAFASYRQPGWHLLGEVFDKPVNTKTMLKKAHLNEWDVHLVDAAEAMPDYHFVQRTLHVVRTNPFDRSRLDVLGTVGNKYRIFQNEEVLDFGDVLTSGRRRWETAGAINGGRRIFATLADPDDIVLDPNGQADVINKYLMLTSSHDASSSLIAMMTNVRVVCRNTLNIALSGLGPQFRIRHTEGIEAKVEDAKRALGYAEKYDEKFEQAAQSMIETAMTDKKFWEIVTDIFPEPEDNTRGRQTKWQNRTDELMALWGNSTGSVQNLEDSAWKAFNVLTEQNQWMRQVRSGNVENFAAAGAGFDIATNNFRTLAFDRVMAEV